MSLTDDIRNAFYALLCDETGTAPFKLRRGHFSRIETGRALDTQDLNGVERRAEIRLDPSRPLSENRNDHWSGNSLRARRMVVRIGYVLTGAGEDFEASGGQSGAGDRDAIENRADEDRKLIVSVCGFMPNFGPAGLTSCVEGVDGALTWLEDRAVLSVPFEMIYREGLPGAPPSNPGS